MLKVMSEEQQALAARIAERERRWREATLEHARAQSEDVRALKDSCVGNTWNRLMLEDDFIGNGWCSLYRALGRRAVPETGWEEWECLANNTVFISDDARDDLLYDDHYSDE